MAISSLPLADFTHVPGGKSLLMVPISSRRLATSQKVRVGSLVIDKLHYVDKQFSLALVHPTQTTVIVPLYYRRFMFADRL